MRLIRGQSVVGISGRAPGDAALANGTIAPLLAWEMHERDGSWQAWVSWVHEAGSRPVHKVVSVQASGLQPLEEPEVYAKVPRRVRGNDGAIRPWAGEII